MAARPRTARRLYLSPFRVAAVFMVVAALWIVGSDMVVGALLPAAADQAIVQTLKGLFFIGVTGGLIWMLTYRLSLEVEDARDREAEALEASARALAAHAAMIDAMTDTLPSGVALMTADGSAFVRSNPAFREITGLSEPLPPPEAVIAPLVDRKGADFDTWREARLYRPDGDSRYVLFRDDPVPGQAVRVLMLQDITERRQQYVALRNSEENYRAIFEQAAVGIAHTSPDGNFLRVNQRYAELVGRDAEALVGLHWEDVTHPEDRASGRPASAALRGGTMSLAVLEKRYLHPDGTVVWARVTVSPVRDQGGDVLYMIGVSEDISERKRMEADLLRSVEELQRSNAELERFAHLASHDLKEPTRTIVSFAQLLERRLAAAGATDEETRGYLEHLMSGARRMRQTVDDLLTYARSDTRQERFRAVNLTVALDAALAPLNDSIAAEGAVVQVRGPLPEVHGLDAQIVQLLSALLGNALKFRHPERPPCITISAAPEGAFWRVEIADNGIGLDQSRCNEAFALFKRLHGPGVTPGSGLGLALARRIVERHGGVIRLSSQPGDGTCVSFTLPAAPEAETAAAAARAEV